MKMTIIVLLCGTSTIALAAGTLSQTDRTFLEHDAQGGLYEIQLSQLALQKSADPKIKQFAQQDISDHAALNEQAEQIAHQNEMSLPATIASDKAAKLKHMSTLDGEAFDRAFVKEMKSINDEDKSDYKDELQNTNDPQMKQFVQQGQATDKKHAEIVDSL